MFEPQTFSVFLLENQPTQFGGQNIHEANFSYLVWTPVPASQDGDPKQHPGPGKIPSGGVPQQVEGVWSGGVALGGDVVALWVQRGEVTRQCRAVLG